ncbi:MAG: acetaldehyde dehydrogenase (acetylating), partial [Anaerovoracaceae bacterium]
GGTGASTGLMPSFTLGCGTMGGSSVSENVTPMHLVNIKRVAYGLKDCATLAQLDPTFNHPELAGSAAPLEPIAQAMQASPIAQAMQASPAAQAAIGYSPTCGSCSPTSSLSANNRTIDLDEGITKEQLADMIESLVQAMKGE